MFYSAELVEITMSLPLIYRRIFLQIKAITLCNSLFLCGERSYHMQGIYEIYSVRSGKRYIGSSKNIEARWQTHIRDLKNRCHHNYYLQQEYQRYGEDNLVFTVVHIVSDEEQLFDYELAYINKFQFSKLFNSLRKPGEVPKRNSRWMTHRENKIKKEESKDEWAF